MISLTSFEGASTEKPAKIFLISSVSRLGAGGADEIFDTELLLLTASICEVPPAVVEGFDGGSGGGG